MTHSRAWAWIVTPVIGALAASIACAQFGLYQLPKDNFIWHWGNDAEGAQSKFHDFSVNGGEQGFQCKLTAKLSALSQLTSTQVRDMENELRTRLDFIYAAATLMNQLDAQRALDWAQLACEKPEGTPSTDEEKAERETKAREKMQREVERRREREARQQQ